MKNSFPSVFNSKGRFTIRQVEVGEADVRNELRVGFYDDADNCVGSVALRVSPQGEPQFVMTTGGDGYLEQRSPLVIVTPTRPHAEAVTLWNPSTVEAVPLRADPDRWESLSVDRITVRGHRDFIGKPVSPAPKG